MSRLIDNQIWNARSFSSLSCEDKLLFLYLETSPETNYYGVFVLPNDQIISARTGLSAIKIKSSLEELQSKGKIAMVDDYIIIFDYFDRQKNNNSEKTKKGLENFEKSLKIEVLDTWLKGRPSPLDTPLIPPTNPLEESKVKETKVNIKESNINIINTFFDDLENIENIIKTNLVPGENYKWYPERATPSIQLIKESLVSYYTEDKKGSKKEIKSIKLTFLLFLKSYSQKHFYNYFDSSKDLNKIYNNNLPGFVQPRQNYDNQERKVDHSQILKQENLAKEAEKEREEKFNRLKEMATNNIKEKIEKDTLDCDDYGISPSIFKQLLKNNDALIGLEMKLLQTDKDYKIDLK